MIVPHREYDDDVDFDYYDDEEPEPRKRGSRKRSLIDDDIEDLDQDEPVRRKKPSEYRRTPDKRSRAPVAGPTPRPRTGRRPPPPPEDDYDYDEPVRHEPRVKSRDRSRELYESYRKERAARKTAPRRAVRAGPVPARGPVPRRPVDDYDDYDLDERPAPRRRAAPQRKPAERPSSYYSSGMRRKNKKGVVIGIIILMILAILLHIPQVQAFMPNVRDFIQQDLTEPTPRLLPVNAEIEMTRVLLLSVNSGIVDYHLQVPYPLELPGMQRVISVSANPNYNKVGNDMTWSDSVPAGTTESISISYHLKVTTYKWEVTPEISGTPANVPSNMAKYLDDEWKIKPSDPNIKTLADQIAGGEPTVYEKVRAISKWMQDNIQYQRQRSWEPKDPLETLSDQEGDCDDQSILFASLARAQGIPAWLEMGSLYDQLNNQWGGHAWLQVYIPLTTGGSQKVNIDPANKEFLVRDPFRFTEWVSDGDPNNFRDYYSLWSFSYVGYADYTPSSNYVTIRFDASKEKVSDKAPGSGNEAFRDESVKVPGFEFVFAVVTITATAIILRNKKAEKM
jgi:transglutaminase-like putative cysteine protease